MVAFDKSWATSCWTCMPGTQWHVVGFLLNFETATRARLTVRYIHGIHVCASCSPPPMASQLSINLASRASKWSSPNYTTMANQGSHSRIQMLTSIRRLASIVTRCRSLISSGPSDLTPNGLNKGTVLGEHAVSVRKESRGGQGQLTRQCLHRGLHNVHYIVAHAHANRHSTSG